MSWVVGFRSLTIIFSMSSSFIAFMALEETAELIGWRPKQKAL